MKPESSDEQTPLISYQNYGSIQFRSTVDSAQTLENPGATLPEDSRSHHIGDSENVGTSFTDALSPDWDDEENGDNPLNWSSWWKYGIIALVSLIELITLVCTYHTEIGFNSYLDI
jgi:hypothetical protein